MSQFDKDGVDKTFVKASPVIRRILELLTEKWGGEIHPRSGRYVITDAVTRTILLSFDYMGIDTSHINRPSSWCEDINNPGIFKDDPLFSVESIFEVFEGGFPGKLINFTYYEKVNLYLRMDEQIFVIFQKLAAEWDKRINPKSQEYIISNIVPRLLLIAFNHLGIDVSYFDVPSSWLTDMTNLRDHYKENPIDKDDQDDAVNVTAELIEKLAPAVAQALLPDLQAMIKAAVESAMKK